MTLRQTTIDDIKSYLLDYFDAITDMGFSSSSTPDSASSDTMSGEFLRKVLDNTEKDDTGFTYLFEATLGLTEGNGNNVNKIGLFTDHSGNTLQLNKVIGATIAKTADREINGAFELTIEFIDGT